LGLHFGALVANAKNKSLTPVTLLFKKTKQADLFCDPDDIAKN